ncbi:MAG: hypothetical protein NTV70_23200 [Acidobacteria bacterium]|nr:hypothetical protein [Acidobacteriota bacterium]
MGGQPNGLTAALLQLVRGRTEASQIGGGGRLGDAEGEVADLVEAVTASGVFQGVGQPFGERPVFRCGGRLHLLAGARHQAQKAGHDIGPRRRWC